MKQLHTCTSQKHTSYCSFIFFKLPAVFCSFRAIDSGLDSFVYYFLSEGWSHSYSYYRKWWAICRLYSEGNGVVTCLLLFRFLCRKHGAIISSVETLDLRITATSWLWDGFDLWFASTKSCQPAANQTKCQIKVKEMIALSSGLITLVCSIEPFVLQSPTQGRKFPTKRHFCGFEFWATSETFESELSGTDISVLM